MNLDVSLHDDVLADELELTARLMIAANASDAPLSTAEVDGILGTAVLAALPGQRTAVSTLSY
ncbi:MAG: hypothetical protein ACTHOK_01985 [Nocardioidaceae bacterium]